MSDKNITRRNSLAWLAGGAATMSLGLAGCFAIPLLLRLFITRAGVGALARSAAVGRSAGLLTMGRATALGFRAATQIAEPVGAGRLVTLPRTNLIGPSRKVVARSVTSGDRTEVFIDGSRVFSSTKNSNRYEHRSTNRGEAGTSELKDNGIVIHKDVRQTIVAIDRVRRAGRLIQHLDNNGNVIGETTATKREDDGYDIAADQTAIEQIELIRRSYALNCEDSKAAYDAMLAARNECRAGSETACEAMAGLDRRYNRLSDRCKAFGY